MRAVVIEGTSGISSLVVRDVPEPQPGTDQVLVHVQAAGLNRSELLQARGLYSAPPGSPVDIPGLEFAGTVIARGSGCVGPVQIGDRVFGIVGGGGLAEFVCTHERLAVPIPQNLDFPAAGAVPEVFITAHDALITQGSLRPGQSVLITGAASGVGLAAVQIANAMGCQVFGTSRTPQKLELSEKFGLNRGLAPGQDTEAVEMWIARETSQRGVDVVIDLIGGDSLNQNLSCLAHRGRLVIVGLLAGSSAKIDLRLFMCKRLQVIGTVLRSRSLEDKIFATHAFCDSVIPWLKQERVRPVVDSVYRLEQIQAAARKMELNQVFGKVVLVP